MNTPDTNRVLAFTITNVGNGTELFTLTPNLAVAGDQFNPNSPDFTYMHQVVQKALAPPVAHHHAPPATQDDTDACAYHPGQAY